MLIVDAHLDLGWNALQWDRNLELSAQTIRTLEESVPGLGRGQGTVALPELAEGRVCLCFATTLARCTGRPVSSLDYGSPIQAYGAAQGQVAYYRGLERAGRMRLIRGAEDLRAHVRDWSQWEANPHAGPPPPLGGLISMESADPILFPHDVEEWWQAGVRVIGPAHYGPGRYAGGTGTELGLTSEGVALLRAMEDRGILLDVTHLSDQALRQALDGFCGSVLASHCNSRALASHQRQLSDPQLRELISRDAVIGVALDVWMFTTGWTVGHASNQGLGLEKAVDHIDHICQLSGDCMHVGIGSDLDGGFGREQSPPDLNTVADLQKLVGLLERRGYGQDEIAAVMHGNWLALLTRHLEPRRRSMPDETSESKPGGAGEVGA